MQGHEDAAEQVVPHDAMPPISAANPSNPGEQAARPCTPQRDRDLLTLLHSAPRSFIGTPGPILDPLKARSSQMPSSFLILIPKRKCPIAELWHEWQVVTS